MIVKTPTLIVCNIVFMFNSMNDTATTLAMSKVTATHPVDCTPESTSRTLCLTRTDQHTGDITSERTAHMQLDGVTITRTEDWAALRDISFNHGIHINRCCNVCNWPRKKFYNMIDSMHCNEQCINPFNIWLFKALKRKHFVRGGCVSQGYHSYVNTTRDIGVFPLPADVYTKVVVQIPPHGKPNNMEMTLSDVFFRIWSFGLDHGS